MKNDDVVLSSYLAQMVVLDVIGPYIYLGHLARFDEKYLVLTDADVHDMRDSTTSRDRYLLDANRIGISPNRRQVFVSREQIVSLSLLSDVVE